jgi:signal transduction histidine kinase/CheY-like chemotaxis protein
MQTAEVESTQPSIDRESRIAAKLVRACYGNMPGAFIGSAVTASFLAAVLYERLPRQAALTWLAAAYANCLVRLLLWQRFRAVAPRGQSILPWGRYAVISSAVAGIVWGSSGTLLHIPGALSDQIVVLLVTIGLAFTSTYLSAAYLPAYRAFVYPTFLLSALPFLLAGDSWHLAIGLGTLAALPLVLRYAGALCRQLRGSIEVRLQNAELVEELRAQKKAAEEANVAKSRFLAVASHDLRQPLHALELFVQALEDSSLPTHAQQLVANVRRSVDSMEELFDALLDISRLDAGVVRPRVEMIPLAKLLERLSFEYATVAQRKGLSLQVMKTSLHVRSDPTLLGRILRNLVANAVRYTERGRIVIGCRRRHGEVSIEVWDTGPGIPAEKHAEIFQEFTQLREPERDRRKGLGLGLAIVERLASLLGHTVTLRSVPGKGSMFAIGLPRAHLEATPTPTPIPDSTEIASRFDLRGRLALLVQAEGRGRTELEQLLRGWQCEVIAAGAGQVREMLGSLRRRPDLIIVGQPTGGESAPALVEMLRNEFNGDVPALLVGSGPAPVEVGALPALMGPFNAARLRTLINNLLHAPVARARRAG